MKKRFLLVSALCTMTMFSYAQKVDFDISNRQPKDVTEDGYQSWVVAQAQHDIMRVGINATDSFDVVINVGPEGTVNRMLRTQWNKALVTDERKARLVGDTVAVLGDDGDGNTLYNAYFKPEHTESWPKAEEVNHISPEMVANAPSIQSEMAAIGNILSRAKTIVGYNTEYDLRFLQAAGWQRPEEQKIVDVMQDFAPIYGEWSEERGDYKWQKLSTCAAWYGYEWTERGAHNSLEDCLATLHCYKEMEKEKVETSAYLNGYHESIYGLIYNWKGLKEENYVYTRSQLRKLDENFDAKADRYDGAIAANKTYMVIRLEGASEEETEQIIRDFLTGKYNEEDLGRLHNFLHEIQDAKVNYNNAQQAYVEGVYNYNVARAALEQAIALKPNVKINIEDKN